MEQILHVTVQLTEKSPLSSFLVEFTNLKVLISQVHFPEHVFGSKFSQLRLFIFPSYGKGKIKRGSVLLLLCHMIGDGATWACSSYVVCLKFVIFC